MTDGRIDLSIIIPAYMEAALIAATLDQLSDYLDRHDYGLVEVLVVVADSPDGTAKIAESRSRRFKSFRIIHAGPRVGKGRDVRLGIFEAVGHYRVFMDADLATPLQHLEEAWNGLQQGTPVMVAERKLWTIHKGLLRKLMSSFGNVAAQIILLPGIKDTQCGFKAFEGEAAIDIFGRMTMLGWSFDAEILKIARLQGYQIGVIEAPDWVDPKAHGMGLVGDSPLHAAIKTFTELWLIRWNVWTGRYRQPNYRHRPVVY